LDLETFFTIILLVDSELCKLATEQKLDFPKLLSSVLQGTIKPSKTCELYVKIAFTKRFPVVTQCCIHELYLQGKSSQPAVDLAKTFERRKCNHREAIPGDECLTSVVGKFDSLVPNARHSLIL
jgi:U3 small nucleolar RNA-associated protein 23